MVLCILYHAHNTTKIELHPLHYNIVKIKDLFTYLFIVVSQWSRNNTTINTPQSELGHLTPQFRLNQDRN